MSDKPPWTCAQCEQVNASWATECGRCGTPRPPASPDATPSPDPLADSQQKVQTLFHFAHTKACVDEQNRPAVAIIAEGNVYAFVMSPRNAMSLALGLIEAANNAVTNTMLFNSLTSSGMPEDEAGKMVTAYTMERRRLLREER